jgi:hypothetical protein
VVGRPWGAVRLPWTVANALEEGGARERRVHGQDAGVRSARGRSSTALLRRAWQREHGEGQRGQGTRTAGQRSYRAGQGGVRRRDVLGAGRGWQRGLRGVPGVRGALGHGRPGEHARRPGERAPAGPEAEARAAGAAWRAGAPEFIRTGPVQARFSPKN